MALGVRQRLVIIAEGVRAGDAGQPGLDGVELLVEGVALLLKRADVGLVEHLVAPHDVVLDQPVQEFGGDHPIVVSKLEVDDVRQGDVVDGYVPAELFLRLVEPVGLAGQIGIGPRDPDLLEGLAAQVAR